MTTNHLRHRLAAVRAWERERRSIFDLRGLFPCLCGFTFDTPVWHCELCGAHWATDVLDGCPSCGGDRAAMAVEAASMDRSVFALLVSEINREVARATNLWADQRAAAG